jgi:hypothetical protein
MKIYIALLLAVVGACNLGRNSGDCDASADCPGSTCIELSEGGFRVCKQVFEEALFCQDQVNGTDECCDSSTCQEGACFDSQQAEPICTGIPPIGHNVCASDDCSQDADCAAGSICSQPGTFNSALRHCIPVSCTRDNECKDERDGSCAPIEDGCCGLTVTMACTYESDGCRSDDDCAVDSICEIEGGRARCVVDQRVCPA